LHRLIAQETGGEVGLRDQGLLESALESAFATFDGRDLFPGKEEKAAKLGYALVSNRAFVDGNKRIGVYVMLTFLEMNGVPMEYENDDLVRVGLSVAAGAMTYEQLLDWIVAHVKYV